MSAGPPPTHRGCRRCRARCPSDTELDRPVASTSRSSSPTLFDRHAAAVHRYLGRRVGDLADDLLSETFLDRLPAAAAYRADARRRPAVADRHRHQPRARPRALRAASRTGRWPGRRAESAVTGADPAESTARLAAQALRGPLAAALAGLKARDRDVLLLFAWGQLSYEEIAAVLDVPVGTVRSRLNRARRQTRAALGPSPSRRPDERHHPPARGRSRGARADDRRPARRPAALLAEIDAPGHAGRLHAAEPVGPARRHRDRPPSPSPGRAAVGHRRARPTRAADEQRHARRLPRCRPSRCRWTRRRRAAPRVRRRRATAASIADYRRRHRENGFTIYVSDDEPSDPDEGAHGCRSGAADEVSIDGRDAATSVSGSCTCVRTTTRAWSAAAARFASLTWARRRPVGVSLGQRARSIRRQTLARRRPPITRPTVRTARALERRLAPAGWSVQFFKMGRRAHPRQRRRRSADPDRAAAAARGRHPTRATALTSS